MPLKMVIAIVIYLLPLQEFNSARRRLNILKSNLSLSVLSYKDLAWRLDIEVMAIGKLLFRTMFLLRTIIVHYL